MRKCAAGLEVAPVQGPFQDVLIITERHLTKRSKCTYENANASQPTTHCQAAQSNAKTKAWQRVCLSHRTKKYDPTNQRTEKNTEAIIE